MAARGRGGAFVGAAAIDGDVLSLAAPVSATASAAIVQDILWMGRRAGDVVTTDSESVGVAAALAALSVTVVIVRMCA